MSIFLRLLTIAILGLISSNLVAMDNDKVIRMSNAGLGDETIIMAIRNSGSKDFDTSADGLITLKEAGVSEAVLQVMIGGGQATAPATRVSGDQPAREAVSRDAVFPPEIDPQPGRTYFTRINFWQEEGESSGTNYMRGILVPINTKAELVSIDKKYFTLRIEGGPLVKIRNEPDYTTVNTRKLAGRYLADEATKIELYGEDTASQIRNGNLRLGMTKDQVLLTRGYPPFHETASLEADRWVFWSSRFVKRTLVFENGILTVGRGLY